jgi:hypothetical protein
MQALALITGVWCGVVLCISGKTFILKLTKAPKGWTMWNKDLLEED